jgi:hypothetical protein
VSRDGAPSQNRTVFWLGGKRPGSDARSPCEGPIEDPRLSSEVTAIGPDFVIMGALATILVIGLQLMRIGTRRDRGQPWALHHADYDDQTGIRHVGVQLPRQESPAADATLDADAAVREAGQIVAAAFRANR